MKLDSDNIRNKFSSIICFWVYQHVRMLSYELSFSLNLIQYNQ